MSSFRVTRRRNQGFDLFIIESGNLFVANRNDEGRLRFCCANFKGDTSPSQVLTRLVTRDFVRRRFVQIDSVSDRCPGSITNPLELARVQGNRRLVLSSPQGGINKQSQPFEKRDESQNSQ